MALKTQCSVLSIAPGSILCDSLSFFHGEIESVGVAWRKSAEMETGGTGTLGVGFCWSWRRSGDVVRFFVGTRGDVIPGVGICKALEARGHEATCLEAFLATKWCHLRGICFAISLMSTFSTLEPQAVKLLGFSSLDMFGSRGHLSSRCQARVVLST